MIHSFIDLTDHVTNLRDKICAFSVMIPSVVPTTSNDKIQCGVSLMLDDLAGDAEALLAEIDELRINLFQAQGKNDD